jgi:hypothetical protein
MVGIVCLFVYFFISPAYYFTSVDSATGPLAVESARN